MAAAGLLSSLLGLLLLLDVLVPARGTGGVGSLNLEELSEMRYGIEILPLPVMGGQVRRRRLLRGQGSWAKGSGDKVEEGGQLCKSEAGALEESRRGGRI